MDLKLLYLIFPLVACLAIFWCALKFSSSKITSQYRLLAERFRLGLDQTPPRMAGFVRPDPSIYGQYRDREVSFSAPGIGYKGTRQTESVLKLELRDNRIKANIAPAGGLGKLVMGKSGKAKTKWESGDIGFDQKVSVNTNNPATFERALTDGMRIRLSDHLKQSKATIYVENGTIAYAKMGLIGNESTRKIFEEAVEFLCDFAEKIEA